MFTFHVIKLYLNLKIGRRKKKKKKLGKQHKQLLSKEISIYYFFNKKEKVIKAIVKGYVKIIWRLKLESNTNATKTGGVGGGVRKVKQS